MPLLDAQEFQRKGIHAGRRVSPPRQGVNVLFDGTNIDRFDTFPFAPEQERYAAGGTRAGEFVADGKPVSAVWTGREHDPTIKKII
jgi:hypothetical protein